MTTNSDRTRDTSDAARIVVGIDGSPAARDALRWALRLAQTEHATVEAVSAWHTPKLSYPTTPVVRTPHEEAEHTLRQVLSDVCGTPRPPGVIVRTQHGDAADVLVEAGRGALMLVVGSRGLTGLRSTMLGSVSRQVTEKAHCPVLVVRPATAAAA